MFIEKEFLLAYKTRLLADKFLSPKRENKKNCHLLNFFDFFFFFVIN